MKIWARCTTYICRICISPPECQQGPPPLRNQILLKVNIPVFFDINHQQNTRRSDQIETIKAVMQTTPSYHMEGFTNGSGCHFKEIFDQVRKDLDCELFYSELKRHNVTLYLLSSHR